MPFAQKFMREIRTNQGVEKFFAKLFFKKAEILPLQLTSFSLFIRFIGAVGFASGFLSGFLSMLLIILAFGALGLNEAIG